MPATPLSGTSFIERYLLVRDMYPTQTSIFQDLAALPKCNQAAAFPGTCTANGQVEAAKACDASSVCTSFVCGSSATDSNICTVYADMLLLTSAIDNNTPFTAAPQAYVKDGASFVANGYNVTAVRGQIFAVPPLPSKPVTKTNSTAVPTSTSTAQQSSQSESSIPGNLAVPIIIGLIGLSLIVAIVFGIIGIKRNGRLMMDFVDTEARSQRRRSNRSDHIQTLPVYEKEFKIATESHSMPLPPAYNDSTSPVNAPEMTSTQTSQ
ncbi:hypothetical protein HDU97_004094 [Phlyctochytrium planicorne]|nr:hypothetical protein HDU97_004094 [Phlyctochytrium planicorne]